MMKQLTFYVYGIENNVEVILQIFESPNEMDSNVIFFISYPNMKVVIIVVLIDLDCFLPHSHRQPFLSIRTSTCLYNLCDFQRLGPE